MGPLNMDAWKAFSTKETRELKKVIAEGYGFDGDLDVYFFINEKEKVFIINKEYDSNLFRNLRINSLGLYLGQYKDRKFRLSVEGSWLIGRNAKNKFEASNGQLKEWMLGSPIELSEEECKKIKYDFVIIQHTNDFFGSGKIDRKKFHILNFFPKSRRIKIGGEDKEVL